MTALLQSVAAGGSQTSGVATLEDDLAGLVQALGGATSSSGAGSDVTLQRFLQGRLQNLGTPPDPTAAALGTTLDRTV